MSETLEQLVRELGDAIGRRAAETFTAEMRKVVTAPAVDPFLTTTQAAKRMGLSERAVRDLVDGGFIPRARGLIDRRIKQSVCDAYGTPKAAK